MKIAIVNGPNLNLTGKREPEKYGSKTFEQLISELDQAFPNVEVVYFQSNVEGEIINFLHEIDEQGDVVGILLNAGGYTHTSVSIADAVAAVSTSVIEIHMTNLAARESFRHDSLIGKHAIGCIMGFGMESYMLGVIKLLNQN